ncbi:DUF1190 domain-containing protein [Qipengyuania aquimaris]|uniref:DUF1190 domain-containing protein n=1 Tax=Qipengyuania aquimaris TaxID=255984 RepID=A0A9Q3S1W9_9SPHN|nr:DUF1190 domain-containing protein [Qipengyuania aquimaris]MBY6218310.1 DUF1190 domain-containing protein [Qipengyuania aquimaris]
MTNSAFTSQRRKRSGRVALTTMAAIGGGAMLSGCGEASAEQAKAPVQVANAETGQEVQVFENVFACAKETGLSREECAEMREEAVEVAKEEAPRFEALADCEAQYGEGKCVEETGSEQQTARRSHFSPFVTAFLWSKTMSRPVPAFSAPGGGYQTGRGVRLGYAGAPGKYYAGARAFEKPRSIPKVKAASAMAKSAGFGEKSRGWNLNSRTGRTATASSRGG